jgi:hypothetical protein
VVHARRIASADPALTLAEHALLLDALVAVYGAEAQAPIPA